MPHVVNKQCSWHKDKTKALTHLRCKHGHESVLSLLPGAAVYMLLDDVNLHRNRFARNTTCVLLSPDEIKAARVHHGHQSQKTVQVIFTSQESDYAVWFVSMRFEPVARKCAPTDNDHVDFRAFKVAAVQISRYTHFSKCHDTRVSPSFCVCEL